MQDEELWSTLRTGGAVLPGPKRGGGVRASQPRRRNGYRGIAAAHRGALPPRATAVARPCGGGPVQIESS
jgi:hypothetical protein